MDTIEDFNIKAKGEIVSNMFFIFSALLWVPLLVFMLPGHVYAEGTIYYLIIKSIWWICVAINLVWSIRHKMFNMGIFACVLGPVILMTLGLTIVYLRRKHAAKSLKTTWCNNG